MSVLAGVLASSIASGLGQSIGSMPATTASGIFSIGAQKRQYRYQKKLMDRQYNQQLDFWNKQNEYNSPAAQIGRLTDANLNPHMMYSSGDAGGTSATGTTNSSPAASMASTPDFRGSGGNPFAISQNKLLEAQANVAKTQAAKNDAESLYYLANAGKLSRGNFLFDNTVDEQLRAIGLRNKETESNISLIAKRTDEAAQNISLMKSHESLNDAQVNLFKEQANAIRELTPWRINAIWSQIKKNDSDIRRNSVLNGLTEYQVLDIAQGWSKIATEMQENMSKKELNDMIREYIPKEFVRKCIETGVDVTEVTLKVVGAILTRGASTVLPSGPTSTSKMPYLFGADGKPVSYLNY